MLTAEVIALTEEVLGPAPFKVGDVVVHHDGKRRVQIRGGSYWGKDGLSNFWYYQEVDAKGHLVGELESGYGWTPCN